MRIYSYLVVSAIVLLGACAGCEHKDKDPRMQNYQTLNPSKDFTLMDQDGKVFHLADHRGQVLLLFFGYLSCPDICPTTMSKLTRAYMLLGPQFRDKVLTLFVSVDPQRDNPAKLKEYLQYFKVNSLGLTGSKEEIDRVVNAYKAVYERVETESAMGYLYNHSDYIYLIDPQGAVKYLFRSEDDPKKIADTIRNFLFTK